EPVGEIIVVWNPGWQGLFGIPGLHSQVVVSLTFLGFFAASAVGAATAPSARPSTSPTRILRTIPLPSCIPLLSCIPNRSVYPGETFLNSVSAVPAAQREPDDPGHRRAQHPQVQAYGAIGDVLEVVDQLVLPGVLTRDPGLGEPG